MTTARITPTVTSPLSRLLGAFLAGLRRQKAAALRLQIACARQALASAREDDDPQASAFWLAHIDHLTRELRAIEARLRALA